MAAPKAIPYPHIVRNPEILAGEPTIAGTRIAVRNIIERSRYLPAIDELCETYPTISREEVEEAFAFYDDHRAEIDRYIAENDAAMISDDW
ncbi:MAG: DUF433 domain-containing protein [Thermomicrobiales bacterium]